MYPVNWNFPDGIGGILCEERKSDYLLYFTFSLTLSENIEIQHKDICFSQLCISKLRVTVPVHKHCCRGRSRKFRKRRPSPLPSPPLFRRCSIQYCGSIRYAKLRNVNVSEDRIKEQFIKRFSGRLEGLGSYKNVFKTQDIKGGVGYVLFCYKIITVISVELQLLPVLAFSLAVSYQQCFD